MWQPCELLYTSYLLTYIASTFEHTFIVSYVKRCVCRAFNAAFRFEQFVQFCCTFCNCTGYFDGDCSLAADAVPLISSFRRGCTCDVRQFVCSRVFIAATDVYHSDGLSCRVQSANARVNRQVFEVNMPLLASWQYKNHRPTWLNDYG